MKNNLRAHSSPRTEGAARDEGSTSTRAAATMRADPTTWTTPNGSPARAAADASPVTTSIIMRSAARPGLTSRTPHRMPSALATLSAATPRTIATGTAVKSGTGARVHERQQGDEHGGRGTADEEGRDVGDRGDGGVLVHADRPERPGDAGGEGEPVAEVARERHAALSAEHHPQPAEAEDERGDPGAGETLSEHEAAEHRRPHRAEIEQQDRVQHLGEHDRDRVENERSAREEARREHPRRERGARPRPPDEDRNEEHQTRDEHPEGEPHGTDAARFEVPHRDPVEPPEGTRDRDRDLGTGEPNGHHAVSAPSRTRRGRRSPAASGEPRRSAHRPTARPHRLRC